MKRKKDSTCVTGEVSGIDRSVAENPYLNLGFLSVTVGILTIDGSAAPSSTYASFDDDAPHPPTLVRLNEENGLRRGRCK